MVGGKGTSRVASEFKVVALLRLLALVQRNVGGLSLAAAVGSFEGGLNEFVSLADGSDGAAGLIGDAHGFRELNELAQQVAGGVEASLLGEEGLSVGTGADLGAIEADDVGGFRRSWRWRNRLHRKSWERRRFE